MARFASSGFKTVDRDSFRVRAEQCLSCEHRQGSRCKVCGCFFDLECGCPTILPHRPMERVKKRGIGD